MIFEHWLLVAADLIEVYAFDPYDRADMLRKPWRSLQTMIGGLFSAETRISRWYEQEHGEAGRGKRGAGHR